MQLWKILCFLIKAITKVKHCFDDLDFDDTEYIDRWNKELTGLLEGFKNNPKTWKYYVQAATYIYLDENFPLKNTRRTYWLTEAISFGEPVLAKELINSFVKELLIRNEELDKTSNRKETKYIVDERTITEHAETLVIFWHFPGIIQQLLGNEILDDSAKANLLKLTNIDKLVKDICNRNAVENFISLLEKYQGVLSPQSLINVLEKIKIHDVGDTHILNLVNFKIGEIYLNQRQKATLAKIYFKQVNNSDPFLYTHAGYNLARFYLNEKSYNKAKYYLLEVEELLADEDVDFDFSSEQIEDIKRMRERLEKELEKLNKAITDNYNNVKLSPSV